MSNSATSDATADVTAPRRPTVAVWYLPLFLLLAVWTTWPLARHATTQIPYGADPIATVPMFNVWTIWWNADRARHGFRDYWQAPIFYPAKDTFAFSEPQPTTLLVAPVVWFSKTPVLAYNVYLLANLALNGWVAARVLCAVYGRFFPALLGGAMVQLLPFVYWQLDVLQLLPLWGILWTFGAVWKFGERPRISHGVSAGLAFGLTYLLCNHHGLFLSVLLVPAGICLVWRELCHWQTWARLLPGAALAVLLIAPLAVVQLQVTRQHEWTRSEELVRKLSLELGDYTLSPWPQLVSVGDFAAADRRAWWQLSPGNVKLALAVVGLVAGLCLRRYRRWTAACFAVLLTALLLSLGPSFSIGPAVPYHWLVAWYPGFSQVRNVFRFALFVQLMTALLACGGLVALGQLSAWSADRLLRRSGKLPMTNHQSPITKSGGRWSLVIGHWDLPTAASAAIVAAAGGLCVFEIRPPEPRLYTVPPVEDNRAWIDWLRENTKPDDVTAWIPFPFGRSVAYYQETTVAMYWGTFHHRRMVNGYSGFFPDEYYELETAMEEFPQESAIRKLRDRGVRYCLVRRPKPRVGPPEFLGGPHVYLVRVFVDDRSGIDVFRIETGTKAEGGKRKAEE